jgi:hypothetical protein
MWTRAYSLVAMILFLFGARSVAVPGQEQAAEPEHAALVAAGRATMARLRSEFASWTVSVQTAGFTSANIIEVVSAPTMRRIVISFENQGQRKELERIIERDGIWYYRTPGKPWIKRRPFEVSFTSPTFYVYVICAELRFAGLADEPERLGTFERMDGDVATYRTPVSPGQRRRVQGQLGMSAAREKLAKAKVAAGPAASLLQHDAELLRDWLDKGMTTRVECQSGLITEYGTPGYWIRVSDFRWLDHADPHTFEVEAGDWRDLTDDPTIGDTNDLLFMSFNGLWKPGTTGTPLSDGRLIELWTGRFRRVPFHGPVAIAGCFLNDRTRMAIAGYDPIYGDQRLYEVNLKTGANRPLGGKALAHGTAFSPTASPDGVTLAALHRPQSVGQAPQKAQFFLVDLRTAEARRIGEPGEYVHPSWFQDGRGLLLDELRSESGSATGRKVDTIVRMDLDGQTTPIIEGRLPTLLGDGKTILFFDTRVMVWKTCDLKGGDVNRYADGLPDYTNPALAPDGKRLLMMRMRVTRNAEPTILLLGDSEGELATQAPGLWLNPSWR